MRLPSVSYTHLLVPDEPSLAVHEVRAVGLLHQEGRDAVLGQPVLRVQVVRDDDVHHAQGQRRVGLRLDGDPLVGDGAAGAQARVHDHDLRAVLARLHEVAVFRGVRVGHVAAPQHHHLGIQIVARVVRAALLAERQPHAHGRAVVAHDALDVERGGAVGAGEARGRLPGQLGQVAGERIEAAGLRAVLRLRLLHAGGYLVDGCLLYTSRCV